MIKQFWPYITGAVAFAIALYQLHSYIYQSGFNSGQQELIRAHNKAIEAQRKEYEIKVQEALNIISDDNASEIERSRSEQKVEYITKEVVKYVDRKIIIPAECDGLAADVVGVLSQATNIVISTSGATKNTDTGEPASSL